MLKHTYFLANNRFRYNRERTVQSLGQRSRAKDIRNTVAAQAAAHLAVEAQTWSCDPIINDRFSQIMSRGLAVKSQRQERKRALLGLFLICLYYS